MKIILKDHHYIAMEDLALKLAYSEVMYHYAISMWNAFKQDWRSSAVPHNSEDSYNDSLV